MAIVKGRKVEARNTQVMRAIPEREWLMLKAHLSARSDVRGMLLHLVQCTGARLDEICKVDMGDVKNALKTGKFFISGSKGSYDRESKSVPPKLLLMLLGLEGSLPKNAPIARLLSSTNNIRSWKRNLQREMDYICDELGIERYAPKCFRHSYCMMLIRDPKNDVATVRQIIGHKSLASTARYLVSANTEDAEARLAKKLA